jgi:hypothetical protein
MRMNVVDLSKRKGAPSALRLVALLSLVLGGCVSRQPGSAQQANARHAMAGQAADGGCPSTWSSTADINIQRQDDAGYTYTVQYLDDAGTDAGYFSSSVPPPVCVLPGGTLKLKGSSSDGGTIDLCFSKADGGSFPFTEGGTIVKVKGKHMDEIKVTSTAKTFNLTHQGATYTYEMCPPDTDGGVSVDDVGEGMTGTLQVGTGVGQEENP